MKKRRYYSPVPASRKPSEVAEFYDAANAQRCANCGQARGEHGWTDEYKFPCPDKSGRMWKISAEEREVA